MSSCFYYLLPINLFSITHVVSIREVHLSQCFSIKKKKKTTCLTHRDKCKGICLEVSVLQLFLLTPKAEGVDLPSTSVNPSWHTTVSQYTGKEAVPYTHWPGDRTKNYHYGTSAYYCFACDLHCYHMAMWTSSITGHAPRGLRAHPSVIQLSNIYWFLIICQAFSSYHGGFKSNDLSDLDHMGFTIQLVTAQWILKYCTTLVLFQRTKKKLRQTTKSAISANNLNKLIYWIFVSPALWRLYNPTSYVAEKE